MLSSKDIRIATQSIESEIFNFIMTQIDGFIAGRWFGLLVQLSDKRSIA